MNQLRQKSLFIYLFIFESKEGKKGGGNEERGGGRERQCVRCLGGNGLRLTRSAHPVRTPAVAGVCRRRRVEEEDRGGFLLI